MNEHSNDKSLSTSERRKLAERYLPKALERIVQLIDSPKERIALDASTWVAEMVLGKPKQEIEDTTEAQTALELAKALRTAIEGGTPVEDSSGIVVEGGVRVLGEQPAIQGGNDFPEEP